MKNPQVVRTRGTLTEAYTGICPGGGGVRTFKNQIRQFFKN